MTKTTDNDFKTILIDPEPDIKQPEFTYYVIPTQRRKRNMCSGGFCCLFLLTFIMLSIYLPKPPGAYLNRLYYNTQGINYGEFVFKNRNYYNMEWDNPDISLYWIPYNGQTVGSICYGEDDSPCESNFFYNNICAIKIGEFKSDLHFNTDSRSETNKNLDMISTSQQQAACAAWMILNPYENRPQQLITRGSITAKTHMTNSEKIKVTDEYYYLE